MLTIEKRKELHRRLAGLATDTEDKDTLALIAIVGEILDATPTESEHAAAVQKLAGQ